MADFPRRLYLDGPDFSSPIRQRELLPPGALPPRLASPEPTGLVTPLFVAGPGAVARGVPQVTNNTTVNVPAAAPAPQPRTGVMGPQNDDERALVSQGGWAGASAAVQPLLGDWRTTPLQVISTALAGYNQGRYGAQQDLAQNRLQQARLDAAQEELQMRRDANAAQQARAAALEASIAKLPPDQQEKVRMLYGLGAEEQAAKVISPDPIKREVVGGQEGGYFAVNPVTGEAEQVVKGMGRAPTQAPESYRTLTPDEVKAMGLPPGTYQMSSRGKLDPIGSSGGTAASPLAKLIAERDALPEGDPRRTAYDAAIAKETTRGGGIRIGPDGSVQIGGDTGAMTQQGQNKVSEVRSMHTALNDAIKNYRDLVNKTGGETLPGADKTALDAARTRVTMLAKDVFTLGALTGPDLDLIQTMVPGATGLDSLYKTKSRVNAGLDELQKETDRRVTAFEQGYGASQPNQALPAPAPGQQAGPTQAAAAAPPATPSAPTVVPQAQAGTPDDAEYQQMFGF